MRGRRGRDGPVRVRLFGIDAPESDQPHGGEAREALRRMAGDARDLRMEVMATDRYGRVVALLYRRGRGRGRSINRAMIEQGHARWYRSYGGEELGFAEAEEKARRRKRGLWRLRDRDRTAPWEHRAARRQRTAARMERRRRGGCLKAVAVAGLLALLTALAVWALFAAGVL